MIYEALPFRPTPERASITNDILRKLAAHETLFTDYERACPDLCMTCALCKERIQIILRGLFDPYSRVWEVWRSDGELAGVLSLSRIVPGGDALAHYVFFDGRLRDKTEVLESAIQWAFTDHPGWTALRRISVEVPDFAFALARHASRYLGFGGSFQHSGLHVEGVRPRSILWRGRERDILLLGRHKDN